ncbi:hypothetical protein AB0K16_57845 [Nonomuraea jabiensis]|uniref:hypothetical protein n=1 Tax=Nonomuraea jabiensis TaxID=882448 RepID=UPI00342F5659
MTRLAAALETTVEDLLGGDRDRPPGPGDAVLKVLEPEECLRLVAPGGIGRVAFNGPEGPTVLVNYRLHDRSRRRSRRCTGRASPANRSRCALPRGSPTDTAQIPPGQRTCVKPSLL